MEVVEFIHSKGLRATPARVKVLEKLGDSHLAFSHTELEATFDKIDRVTLYRVLSDFEDAGIAHKLIGTDGVTRYAVCGHNCPDKPHIEQHVHFNCNKCGKIYCLANTHTPSITLPKGFTSTGINTIVQGVCKSCS